MKELIERYWHYKDVLDRMGSLPIHKDITIKDLGLSRGTIQSGYKEMKKLDFEGTIIDYLCLISTVYLLERATSLMKAFGEITCPIPGFQDVLFNLDKKTYEKKMGVTAKKNKGGIDWDADSRYYRASFLEMCFTNENGTDIKNMIRLWKKDAVRVSDFYNKTIESKFKHNFGLELFLYVISNIHGNLLNDELKQIVKK